LAYGYELATQNLLLYASKTSQLSFHIEGREFLFHVLSLDQLLQQSLADYDGLVWYAFLLKSKLPIVGLNAYRDLNDSIAGLVFQCIALNPQLRTVFLSSGAAYGLGECPTYDSDPYAHLKIVYEQELNKLSPLITLYPYATLGRFVPDHHSFAAASFIYQAKKLGSIVLTSRNIVVRSYGSVHDFSRLILRLFCFPDWSAASIPARIIPVTHTLDLTQLANEVAAALSLKISVKSSIGTGATPSIYVASDYSYESLLARLGIKPTCLSQQIYDMSTGSAFL
jgi:hypothetical protein